MLIRYRECHYSMESLQFPNNWKINSIQIFVIACLELSEKSAFHRWNVLMTTFAVMSLGFRELGIIKGAGKDPCLVCFGSIKLSWSYGSFPAFIGGRPHNMLVQVSMSCKYMHTWRSTNNFPQTSLRLRSLTRKNWITSGRIRTYNSERLVI